MASSGEQEFGVAENYAPPDWLTESWSRRVLLTDPSKQLWLIELRRLINEGYREGDLQEAHGTASSYVKAYLKTRGDRAVSRQMFMDALREFFSEWNPRPSDPLYRFNNALSILESFKPSLGFKKIVTFVDQWNWFGPGPWRDRIEKAGDDDPHLLALRVMVASRQSVLDNDPGAERSQVDLVRILRQTMEAAEQSDMFAYAPYAAVQLLDMELVDPADPSVWRILESPAVDVQWRKLLVEKRLALIHRSEEQERILAAQGLRPALGRRSRPTHIPPVGNDWQMDLPKHVQSPGLDVLIPLPVRVSGRGELRDA